MSAIYHWIISIAGAICLTVLIDVLMQDGETKKYVKGITALIVLSIVVAPLPSFLNNDFTLLEDETYEEIDYEVNKTYISEVNQAKSEYILQNIEILIKNKGYGDVTIYADISTENDLLFNLITVDLTQSVINDGPANINIIEDIKTLVSEYTGVSSNQIIIQN